MAQRFAAALSHAPELASPALSPQLRTDQWMSECCERSRSQMHFADIEVFEETALLEAKALRVPLVLLALALLRHGRRQVVLEQEQEQGQRVNRI
jgi:hypothetical protein|tara:strand:- start:1319 stop:1603 length:285 start_codon:yes stop_codon:yes gene_type:complete